MTTITTDMLKFMAHTLGTTPAILQLNIRTWFGVTIDDTPADTDTEAQEAAMQDDVERVARALCRLNGLCVGFCHTERCPTAIRQYGEQARAAMAATREIDAEAILVSNDDIAGVNTASRWLQQRANDVKETGNG